MADTPLHDLAHRFIEQTQIPVFLTGKAGTGKTTFLRKLIKTTFKNTVVAAPTGIAAINAGGVTLHSLFQLPFGIFLPDDSALRGNVFSENIHTPYRLISQSKLNSAKRNIIRKMDRLVIDEVSMLRADLLDAVDQMLRHIRKRPADLFGGVQLVFIGDLFQLPPVVQRHEWQYLRNYYPGMYFFNATCLRDIRPVYIEFNKVFRQKDEKFIHLLNAFRDGTVSRDQLDLINKQYNPGFDTGKHKGYIHITTHNRKADKINLDRLDAIKEKAVIYSAKISGDFGDNLFPTEYDMALKKGAQVMFIKNDPSGEGKYFNGKIGEVSYLTKDEVIVSFQDGSPDVTVEPYLWENKRYTLNDKKEIEEETIGSFQQIPLRLAWAITVHKSQGLTFEKAVLDLSDSFAPGQMYVALSRLTSLEGLVLSEKVPATMLEIDPTLRDFVSENQQKQLTEEELKHHAVSHLRDFAKRAFHYDSLLRDLAQHTSSYDKTEGHSAKQKYESWAKQLASDAFPLKEVADSFKKQIDRIMASPNPLPVLQERTEKAREYFGPRLLALSDKVNEHIATVSVMKGTKKYCSELRDIRALFHTQYMAMKKLQALVRSTTENRIFDRNEVFTPSNELEKAFSKEPLPVKKGETKRISLDLFKELGSIESVALKRDLTPGTIMTHLIFYVKKGELEVLELIDKEKRDNILKVIETLSTPTLTSVKEKLGDEYTYDDVKLVLAWRESEKAKL